MINLPAALITQKNLVSSSDAWLLLVELTLTDGNIFRLVRNTEDIFFASDNYSDVGCIAHWKMNDDAASTVVADSSPNGNNGTANRNTNLMKSLVAHWKMNDALATTNVLDATANGNDGTANRNTNLMTAAGKVNEALNFNGTSDEIQIPEFSICNSDTNRSMSFWIKAASGQPYENPRMYIAGTARNFYMYTNGFGNSGSDSLFVISDGVNYGVVQADNGLIYTNTWHHIIVTVDRSTDIMKLYIDDVLKDTTDISGVGNTAGTGALYIGSAGGTYFLDGTMDSVMVFDKALSQADVTALNNSDDGTEENVVDVGKIDGALYFNGTTDGIQIPEFSICNSDTNRSISFWVKAASGQPMLNPRMYHGGNNFYMYTDNYGNSGSNSMFIIWDGSNGGIVRADNSLIFTDTWHHIVVTVDRSTDIMKLYIDNVLQDTDDISSIGDTSLAPQDFFLGVAGGWFFDGTIDNVMIYNRALAADEVSAIYNSGNGTEQLLARYTAFGFDVEPIEQNASGEIPTVTLRTCNVTRYLQPYIEDLDGGIGSIVKLTIVNTNQLEENYSELEMEFEVLESESDAVWIIFTLGAPNPLRKRFPLNRYFAGSCRWKYRDSDNDISIECNYGGKSISGIANTNPCQITANSHGLATGNEIFLEDIVDGGAGTLEDALNDLSFEIIVIDSNTFSVAVDATGLAAYSSGGTSGYNECKRTLEDCAEHENEPRYGGIWGLTQGGALIA